MLNDSKGNESKRPKGLIFIVIYLFLCAIYFIFNFYYSLKLISSINPSPLFQISVLHIISIFVFVFSAIQLYKKTELGLKLSRIVVWIPIFVPWVNIIIFNYFTIILAHKLIEPNWSVFIMGSIYDIGTETAITFPFIIIAVIITCYLSISSHIKELFSNKLQ